MTYHDTKAEFVDFVCQRGSKAANEFMEGSLRETFAEFVNIAQEKGVEAGLAALESYVSDAE